MNFLAHAYLSGDDERILVGNFIGDFIKGRQALDRFDPVVIRGVSLHRAIDEFTDEHSVVHESKDRLRPTYRHYAGVIVDIFYDHLLARNWKSYHPLSLEEFAAGTYRTMTHYNGILPAGFKRMLPHMIRGNWLVNYAHIRGIQRVLSGMASRTPYDSKMELASADLQRHYEDFDREFQIFFPQLRTFAERWLLDGNAGTSGKSNT